MKFVGCVLNRLFCCSVSSLKLIITCVLHFFYLSLAALGSGLFHLFNQLLKIETFIYFVIYFAS
jgi:hypothetical protein